MIRALGTFALVVASFLGAMFLILVSLVFAGPLATIGALLALTGLVAWRGRTRKTYYHPALDDPGLRAVAEEYAVPREPTPGRERLGL